MWNEILLLRAYVDVSLICRFSLPHPERISLWNPKGGHSLTLASPVGPHCRIYSPLKFAFGTHLKPVSSPRHSTTERGKTRLAHVPLSTALLISVVASNSIALSAVNTLITIRQTHFREAIACGISPAQGGRTFDPDNLRR